MDPDELAARIEEWMRTEADSWDKLNDQERRDKQLDVMRKQVSELAGQPVIAAWADDGKSMTFQPAFRNY
jgi:hypothetical protein